MCMCITYDKCGYPKKLRYLKEANTGENCPWVEAEYIHHEGDFKKPLKTTVIFSGGAVL